MEPRGVPEATGMRLERSVEPGVSGLSLLGAPRRVTQSPEFLSKLESGVGGGSPQRQVLGRLGCSWQVTLGTGRTGRRKEGQPQVNGQKGEAPLHPGLNGLRRQD